MEVYAGYSENADHNVGRVIDAIDELGELDNTLIVWIWGDNGASMEGTLTGSFNELTMQNGIPLTDEMQLQLAERYGGLEAWGEEIMAPHYGAAWAWAGNTPFQWGKQVGIASRWEPQPDGHPLAGPRGGPGLAAAALDARDRHRSDDPRDRRHPGAELGGWDRPAAAAWVRLQRLARGCERARASHAAVFRGRRQQGHVQGWLVARHEDSPDPVARSPPRRSSRMPRGPGTRTTIRPSSTTCPTISARHATLPSSGRTRSSS